jgi:hypothetical protein
MRRSPRDTKAPTNGDDRPRNPEMLAQAAVRARSLPMATIE